jgi:hypothetical protein
MRGLWWVGTRDLANTRNPYDRRRSQVHYAGRHLIRVNMNSYATFGLVVVIPDHYLRTVLQQSSGGGKQWATIPQVLH